MTMPHGPTGPTGPTAANAPAHDHSLAYAEEDLGEIDAASFSRRAAPGDAGVLVTGACPRCHGRTQTLFPWGMPGTGGKGVLRRLLGAGPAARPAAGADPLVDEVHFCECGHAHPLSPADTSYRGCGASWRLGR